MYRGADIAYQNNVKYFAITRNVVAGNFTEEPYGHAIITLLNKKPSTKAVLIGTEIYETIFLCKQMFKTDGIQCGNLQID